jgi:hypothetical protein
MSASTPAPVDALATLAAVEAFVVDTTTAFRECATHADGTIHDAENAATAVEEQLLLEAYQVARIALTDVVAAAREVTAARVAIHTADGIKAFAVAKRRMDEAFVQQAKALVAIGGAA